MITILELKKYFKENPGSVFVLVFFSILFILVLCFDNDTATGAFLAVMGGFFTLIAQEYFKNKQKKEKSKTLLALLRSELLEINGMVSRLGEVLESKRDQDVCDIIFYEMNSTDLFFSFNSNKKNFKDIDAEVMVGINRVYYNARLFIYNLSLVSDRYLEYKNLDEEASITSEGLGIYAALNTAMLKGEVNSGPKRPHRYIAKDKASACMALQDQYMTTMWRLSQYKDAYADYLDMEIK